jgi:hypothetical protein
MINLRASCVSCSLTGGEAARLPRVRKDSRVSGGGGGEADPRRPAVTEENPRGGVLGLAGPSVAMRLGGCQQHTKRSDEISCRRLG